MTGDMLASITESANGAFVMKNCPFKEGHKAKWFYETTFWGRHFLFVICWTCRHMKTYWR